MNRIFCFALFLPLFLCGPSTSASAQPSRSAMLDCGGFQVKAATTPAFQDNDILMQATSQTIRLRSPSRHLLRNLDLMQHSSHDPVLNGRLALDGVASRWRCSQSSQGEDFLIVDFYCTNRGARTCDMSLTSPTSEWEQIFDSSGKAILRHPTEYRAADIARIHQLGLTAEYRNYATPREEIFSSWVP